MKFQMPETLDGLSLSEISELASKALAEANELNAIPDDKITAEQSAELIELVGYADILGAREIELQDEEQARIDKLAAARASLQARNDDGGDAGDDEGDEGDDEGNADDADGDEGGDEDADAKVEERELVTASAGAPKRGRFSAKVARQDKTPAPDPEAEKVADKEKSLSIIAAANVPGVVATGDELPDLDALAKAFVGRGKSFVGGARGARSGQKTLLKPGRHGLSPAAQRFGVAQLHKPENPFTIGEKDSIEAQYDMIKQVSSERRLSGGSLVASLGWCAPSERIWGFLELEKTEALLSIPEMVSRRGGIEWTRGPQLGDLLTETDLGWIYTEAEVESGEETKPCFVIECPDWDELRLDATGFCIKAGLLTASAYPELIRRYLGLGLTVHARRLNALTINRISTQIGAATTFAAVGATPSATSDLLAAIELNVMRLRFMYSLGVNDTVEGVFPLWVQAIVRSDLSRRTGVDLINVSNSMIQGWFRDRGVLAQFVYDYQNLNSGAANTAGGTAGWTRYPDAVEFMLYPAGSFVRLGTDVIDLDTVYDSDNLSQNMYTAAFFEEGFAVANMGASGVKVRVALPNLFGSTGFPAVGAGEGVTIPVPVPEAP